MCALPADVLLDRVTSIVPREHVLAKFADRLCYSYDSTNIEHMPDVVVRPGSAGEISEVLKLANATGTPVFPRGAGTGLSGGSVPITGGIVMDLTRMNRILDIDTANLLAVVEPGVVTLDLFNKAASLGLLYPPDPGSNTVSTIGGNVAENAGGLRGLKYGVTKDYIMALEIVSPEGGIWRSGSKTVKCVTGYDLTKLMVGSEGTLGVFTSITCKLVPMPEHSVAMLAVFDDIDLAAATVAAIIRAGILPSTLEFLDRVTCNVIEDFKPCGLPRDAEAVLLLEADGVLEAATKQAKKMTDIASLEGAREVIVAKNEEEKARVWSGRRAALGALARVRPTTILEDATVPRSEIPAMVRAVREIASKYNLMIGTFGHAGDGNLHPTILTDERDREEMHRVEAAIDELFKTALALGGTLSGEHGIGLAKAPFLHMEMGEVGLATMRRIKQALDPKNILNPGKMALELGGDPR
ncbi:MAG: FAD-binding protein [Firmicutes bacterium]|jgi:glycolate oxidase|nr:FAD-binding protein [Bacillota bacterium]